MRHTLAKWLLWCLGLEYLPVMDTSHMKPFVIDVEREGKLRGWNGASKRQIAMERYVRTYGDTSDKGLLLELAVRQIH